MKTTTWSATNVNQTVIKDTVRLFALSVELLETVATHSTEKRRLSVTGLDLGAVH